MEMNLCLFFPKGTSVSYDIFARNFRVQTLAKGWNEDIGEKRPDWNAAALGVS